ncbi:TRAP transporter small permease subunit [Leucobacter denitrificans]|uniref:TRAP transporter small permease n=1 Tax=Leucobacter denitrificans TaxID=683042 RepID=A0A7G9S3G4_9MICO|nr:TRAP transporter small permease [Leucobacter denitrificans]QNN62389.1 TRAP transporter small permease [Leucobacter denitrificans]
MTEPTTQVREGVLRRSIHVISRTFGIIAVLVIVFMMVATVADVARRYFTGAPIPGVTEAGEVLMVMAVFLGIAFTEYRGAHVRVTLVLEKLPPRVAAIINSLAMLVVLLLLAWMVWVTTGRALESIEVDEVRFGLVKIPVWPGRIAIAVGLAAYFLEAIPRLYDSVRQAFAKEPTFVVSSASSDY